MSGSNSQSLTESARFAYLQAMDVTVWRDRDEFALEEKTLQEQEKNITQKLDVSEKEQPNKKLLDKEIPSLEKNKTENQSTEKASHFVKMVSWHSGIQSSASLLIICRHDPEQPANSFAKPHAPSQFMTDYINALIEFLDEDNKDCYIRLGHLSQAGLGKDCQSFPQTIQELKPKVVLMLGEETIKELNHSQTDLASLRGKVFQVDDHKNCIASYHPFTLIKNPQLKSLAMDDLKMLASLLAQKK